jgi:hypothetical protein
MTIEDYLELLRDTPLPSILVIGGIAFLLLSVLQRAGTSIETKPGRERFAVFTGVVLLLGGIGLYLVPPTQQPPVTPTAIAQQGEQQPTTVLPVAQSTDTPKAIATTRVPPLISTPTVQPITTVTPVPPSGCGGWCEETGQIPASGTRISKDLAAGQLMFLSGGQLLINGKYCGDDAQQICVVIYEASKPQTVVVDAVIAKNNYVGITDTFSPEEALSIKTSAFWKPPNCINGCKKATVLFFRDSEFVKQETLTP